jgi:predicted methyltransferase
MSVGKGATTMNRVLLLLSYLLGSILLCTPALAENESVNPGINQHYQDPDFDTWVGRFEHPGREVYDQRKAIVAAAGIKPGMAVADIGAGTGLFTKLFAPAVGQQGRVYAVDIAENFVDNIQRIAAERDWPQVRGVVNTAMSVGLPPDSIDLAFVCDTYHHFEYPQSMLASIRTALKPGGRLIVIDFRKVPGQTSEWVMNHVRANKQTVIKEIEQAGFKLTGEESFLKTNYYLHFSKRD